MADQRAALATVRSTAIDGRLTNIFWRLDQLRNLHGVLAASEAAVLAAIVNDAHIASAEAKVEYYLTLASVKQQYASLSPEKSLEDEYRVANGKDAPDRSECVGIVYVEPTAHTLFYSAIAPLASAIAAGNCVVVQLENTLREVPDLLRKLLQSSLDPDIYAIVPQRPDDEAFLANCAQLLQNGSSVPASNLRLVSPAQARVVAIVDRTADLEEAAKAIVAARFSFGGRSSYAPDVVLVNEFVKAKFLNAVVQHSIRYLTEADSVAGEKAGVKARTQGHGLIDELKAESGLRVVTAGSNGGILDVEARDSTALAKKISERCLCVHAISSLDDGIDLANSGEPLLATYLFATPASGKYMSQFIRAHASFLNHFPLELLLGPAAPVDHPLNPSNRFPASLFTIPRPQYIKPTPLSQRLGSILQSTTTGSSEQLRLIKSESTAALPPNRPYTKSIGFFEQGILLGLGMTAIPLVSGVGALAYYGSRVLLARLRP